VLAEIGDVDGEDFRSGDATAVNEHGTLRYKQRQGEQRQDEQRRLNLPRDVGWMMVSVGLLGVILPGLPGTPFLLAGIAVLAPGGPRLLTRWAGRKPKGFVHTSLKLVGRWLDDLERRYP
jgi:hypothetical protein